MFYFLTVATPYLLCLISYGYLLIIHLISVPPCFDLLSLSSSASLSLSLHLSVSVCYPPHLSPSVSLLRSLVSIFIRLLVSLTPSLLSLAVNLLISHPQSLNSSVACHCIRSHFVSFPPSFCLSISLLTFHQLHVTSVSLLSLSQSNCLSLRLSAIVSQCLGLFVSFPSILCL